MSLYEYQEAAWKILDNSLSDHQKEVRRENGEMGNLYCTFISFISNYLAGYKYFNSWIDEINDEEINREVLTYAEALYLILQNNHSLFIKKEVNKEIMKYLNENKNNIIFY